VEGLAVIDASVFPTGLGVNPQMTIYALSARNATRLAADLGGKVKVG
jgi:choline dehydrogenase-like flavoprotein